MRVAPWLVVVAALAFKLWLWWRTAPAEAHHIICIVALWFFVAIMATIWMQRTEPKDVQEFICSDPAQRRRIDWDYELCEWKLRNVRSGHSALRGIIA